MERLSALLWIRLRLRCRINDGGRRDDTGEQLRSVRCEVVANTMNVTILEGHPTPIEMTASVRVLIRKCRLSYRPGFQSDMKPETPGSDAMRRDAI